MTIESRCWWGCGVGWTMSEGTEYGRWTTEIAGVGIGERESSEGVGGGNNGGVTGRFSAMVVGIGIGIGLDWGGG